MKRKDSVRREAAAIAAAAAAAAAGQETPWGLNRFALLCLYLFYVFSTGCVYFGWTSLSKLLFSAGLYSFLCDPVSVEPAAGGAAEGDSAASTAHLAAAEGAAAAAAPRGMGLPSCSAQEAAVHKLFTITVACHFSSALLVGLLLDRLGPLKTAIIGQTLGFCGWALLATFNHETLNPIPAFVLIGFAVDASLLPSIGIANLFPKNRGIIMALTGSAASASVAIPVLLQRVSAAGDVSGLKCLWWYVGLGPATCWLLSLFIIPCKPFLPVQEIERQMQQQQQQQKLQQQQQQQQQQQEEDTARETILIPFTSTETDAEMSCPLPAAAPNNPTRSSSMSSSRSSSSMSSSRSSSSSSSSRKGVVVPAVVKPFWRYVTSLDYVVVVLYFIVVAALHSFYQQTAQRFFPSRVVCTLEVLLPFEFMFSLPLGALIDAIGVPPVFVLLNTAALIMYLCTFASLSPLYYVSIICFVAYLSMFLTPLFVFLQCRFPASCFGRLAGLAMMLGGLFSLSCNPLLDSVIKGGPQGLLKAKSLMLGISLLQYLWLSLIWIRDRKRRQRDTKRRQQQFREQPRNQPNP